MWLHGAEAEGVLYTVLVCARAKGRCRLPSTGWLIKLSLTLP